MWRSIWYLLSMFQTMIFCMHMQLPLYKPWFPLHFEPNTSGKYITPPISFLKPFLKQLSYELKHLFKTSSGHNWVWSFYKTILLIMKMVVWLIHVVWIMWSSLWWLVLLVFYSIVCVLISVLLDKVMEKRKGTK